jgi:hypothetical protein
MKRVILFLFISIATIVQIKAASYDSVNHMNSLSNKLNFHFASKAEGQLLKMGDTIYYNRLSQADIDWRMRKENATIEELMEYGREQILDFTYEEQIAVSKAMAVIEDSLTAIACNLPIPEDIVFIKTTMKDEGSANAYTIKNQIFLSSKFLVTDTDENPEAHNRMLKTLAHELFHCISRNSPSFRQQMYSLIGFTVMDKEIDFPESVRARIMANPDVDKFDNFGTFVIDGKKHRCALLTLYKSTWAEAYSKQGENADFIRNIDIVLIPLDDLNSCFSPFQVPGFWKKVGQNTLYVLSPEECMADNFSFAVVPSKPRDKYSSPQLIKDIIEKLRLFQ